VQAHSVIIAHSVITRMSDLLLQLCQ